MLVEKIIASGDFEGFEDQIDEFKNNLKSTDITYYIDFDGKISVILPAYTAPFYGNWIREYKFDDLLR